MNRTEFVNRLIRYFLFGLLGLIMVLAGRKAVTGNNCSACPGKGICAGETDCSKYLNV
jgi:hypothetical protein